MNQQSLRILLTSDMHCTDLMDWYGVRDEVRLQAWVDAVLAEHRTHPFDAIIIAGDISLDYHAKRTPYDKGHSTGLTFMQQFVPQLPQVPRFILAGNHEQFPAEDWRALVGNDRQGEITLGQDTFLCLDGFCQDLGPIYDSSDKYTPMDMDYIQEVMASHPNHRFWLISHYFDIEAESEAFRTLLATNRRIKGLFMGHTHLNTLIPLGATYQNLVIAQTGNFSYTLGDLTRDFWGLRDLIITDQGAVSRYLLPESHICPGGKNMVIPAAVRDVATYRWEF